MLTSLDEVHDADAERVGGKALNCARLKRAGFRVPDGLVLSTDASEADRERVHEHPWFAIYADDQRFAVRSSGIGEDSAGHSFAGIHETFLNVARADVPAAVGASLLSAASEQATAYRRSHGLDESTASGVLIQPMVDATYSGVAFTAHPVTGANEILVESVPGLGDDVVSGRVQPDQYRIDKNSGRLIASTVAAGRQPIAENGLRALWDVLVRVDAHYGTPQDVEWAVDDSGVWVLQARPITGLHDDHRPSVDVEWTRANLAEVMPDQTSPQVLDAYEELLNASQRLFAGGLLAPEHELGPPFKAFGGRLYFNLSQLIHLARTGGGSAASVKRSLGHPEAIGPEDEVAPPLRLGTLFRRLPDVLRLAWLEFSAPRLVRWLDADNAQSAAKLTASDMDTLSDGDVWARLMEWRATGPPRMVVVLVHGGVMMLEERLRRACRAVGQGYEQFVYAQLAAGEPSVSTQQAFDLVDIADVARSERVAAEYFQQRDQGFSDYRERLVGTRFLHAFDRFLDRYGHRGLYESDWALPRYREDPAPLLFAIRTHVVNPPAESRTAIVRRLEADAAEAWRRFDAALTGWQRVTLRPRVRALVTRLKQRYVAREYCRSELIKVLYHARRLHLLLARRFAERGWLERTDDYFMLLGSEIEPVIQGASTPSTLAPIAAARRRQWEHEKTLKMPLLMRQSDVPRVLSGTEARPISTKMGNVSDSAAIAGSRLAGLCVSRGIVEGEVVVIRDPREFGSMRRGAILVAPATDPSWTPLFTLASGVIVEIGGILSHASTVAREYGLPALANVMHATTRLKTGDRVRLDASAGWVEWLA